MTRSIPRAFSTLALLAGLISQPALSDEPPTPWPVTPQMFNPGLFVCDTREQAAAAARYRGKAIEGCGRLTAPLVAIVHPGPTHAVHQGRAWLAKIEVHFRDGSRWEQWIVWEIERDL